LVVFTIVQNLEFGIDTAVSIMWKI